MSLCKTLEEAELTGRAGIKIFTYSWESLYVGKEKGELQIILNGVIDG